MKRRELLTYGLVAALGAGAGALFYKATDTNMAGTASDLERQLLTMVRPESARLVEMYPQFANYEATVAELERRGLVYKNGLDMTALETRRASDPIIEFAGWQRLETELLVMLAAWQLAGKHLIVTSEQPDGLSFENFEVVDGVDAAGVAIATYRIDSPTDHGALSACIDLCAEEEKCRNITLGKPGHPVFAKKNTCWLTDDQATRSPSPYYFTARKKP